MLKAIIDMIRGFISAMGAKPKVSEVMLMLLTMLPQMVTKILTVSAYSNKDKFDEVLNTFDAYTGSDPGSIDIIRDLPADKEEEFFDHIKEAIRILGYHQLKINGYVVAETSEKV